MSKVEKIQYTTEEQIAEMFQELDNALEKNNKGVKGPMLWIKRATNILLSLFIIFLLVVLGFIITAKANGKTPSLFGYRLFIVESGSMQPTFDIGTVILSKEPSDPSNLSVGDVVTFKSLNDTTVTHRIIEVVTDEDGSIKYRTKGDNPLNSPDSELLDPERVISVYVFKIPLT